MTKSFVTILLSACIAAAEVVGVKVLPAKADWQTFHGRESRDGTVFVSDDFHPYSPHETVRVVELKTPEGKIKTVLTVRDKKDNVEFGTYRELSSANCLGAYSFSLNATNYSIQWYPISGGASCIYRYDRFALLYNLTQRQIWRAAEE